MVNIKCISEKEKITKISEISKIRECLEDNRVDITQQVSQRNRRKGRTFISAFILVLCMCLTGCGSGNDIVKDYGARSETEDEQNGESSEKISAKGKTVREMVGGDMVKCEDRFEVNGISVEFDAKGLVPDVQSLNAYTATGIGDMRDKEEEIVHNLFGDTAEVVENAGEIGSYNGFTFGGSLGLDGCYDEIVFSCDTTINNSFDEDESLDMIADRVNGHRWIDKEDYFLHMYKGIYDGNECGLIYAFSYKTMRSYIALKVLDFTDYFPDRNVTWCYSRNTLVNEGDKMIGYDGIYQNIINKTNAMSGHEEEALKSARSFVSDEFAVGIAEDMAAFSFESDDADAREQLLFLNEEEKQQIDSQEGENIGLCDGYRIYIDSCFSGLHLPYVDDADRNMTAVSNYGTVYVTSRGIAAAYIEAQVNITDVTENILLLDSGRILESFKDIIINDLDMEQLKGLRRLYFNRMTMCYYPVQNPDDENEYTYIPVWEFMTNGSALNSGGKSVVVYVNAIDGSLIDAVY
ncbi:MAG: hypothetical protein IJ661_06435 [Lachnospiraceae bacterium]|nr:hypothetical protein [Lachnospiraceae bacterium]